MSGMEVFGVVAGATTLVEGCAKLAEHLMRFLQRVKEAHIFAAELQAKADHVRTCAMTIQRAAHSRKEHLEQQDREEIAIWNTISSTLRHCARNFKTLEDILREIAPGKENLSWLEKALLQRKIDIREPQLLQLEKRIDSHLMTLNTAILSVHLIIHMSYHDHITSMFANGHLAVMNRLDDVLDRDEDQLHSSIKAFNHEKQPEGSSTGKMECTSGVGAELGQNDIPWHDSRMALESGSMMKKRAVRHSVANMVSTDESHDQSVFSEYRENLERSSRRRSTSLSSSSVFKRNVLQTTFVAVDANTMDPNTYFDDTTPRELLDTLIERLHKQVISDISSHRHLQAEHHLLDTILHLEERYIAYGVPFNDLQEMQNQLAGIYRKQGKDEEASEIIFASLRNRSKPEQTIKAPAMVDAGVTPDNAEQYYQLGLMHLVKYQSNKKLVYLDAAERDAKRAFKCSLKARAVWPEPFIHAVSLLVQVYKDKGKLVHADTYHDLYLQKSKSLSNPPSRPSSHTCLSAISHSSSTSNVINGNENPDNVDHLSIETDPKPGLSGKTTMIEAVETDNRNAIQKLRHGGAQLDHALLDAAKNGKGDITQLLLDLDAPKEMKDESGATPLLIAAKHAHTMIVQQLLDHHTDVNAKDNHGWSVIHYAAHQRSVDMMLMLLRRDYQVDVNATCVDGKTGLHYLAETGNVPTARVLLQHQADAKIKDTTSRTPLDIAIRRRRYDFVDMLLRNNVLTFNPDSLLVTSQEIKNLLGQTKEYLEY